ncbi:MAG TPA: threonylcarbamoyl-AMP synthase, partial [Desulfobacteraceae bacterium]|nr:threonylcarbamoyl-AMP synthase [Desulfobacteraceae bacterium]
KKAGKILAANGVVIFPAQCLYGVAANALDPTAVEKVFRLKQRPMDNPILVLIRNKAALHSLVTDVPPAAEKIMTRFWPGGITLVFNAAPRISPRLTANTGKIGIRLPGHPVAKALTESVDFPITGTSANLSGQPGCMQATELPRAIVDNADLILDAGRVQGGTGSTILDVTCTTVRILRHGAVNEADIRSCLG